MNEQRFTVHINFVKSKRFLKKKRISGLYLNFWYPEDHYNLFYARKLSDDCNTLILATLYAPSVSLMEDFKCSIGGFSLGFFSSTSILHNDLIINKRLDSINYDEPISIIDDIDDSSLYPSFSL